jgi:regulator of nonsense transcripts 3
MAEISSSSTTTTDTVTRPAIKPTNSATPLSAQDKEKQKALEKKKKRRDRRKKKAKRVKKDEPKTKVVVRRLPPNLPEHIFMTAVQQWTSDEMVDFKTFIPGKLSSR